MNKSLLLVVLVFGAQLSAPACKRAIKAKALVDDKSMTSPGSLSDSAPIADSGDIVATVQLPTGVKLTGLAKAIDNIQPGASKVLTAVVPMGLAKATGMEMSAIDLNAPISIVIVNPKKYAKPAALLVKAKDADALRKAAEAVDLVVVSKKGLSLIGQAAVVEATQNAAFNVLAKPASQMLLRIYPGTLLKLFKDDLHRAIERMSGLTPQYPVSKASRRAYEDIVTAVTEQTEYIDVTIDSGDGESDLFVRLKPRAGTTMASLAAAQVPSKYELLAKLPADNASTMIFAGDMRAGAAREPMADFFMKMLGAIMPEGDNTELAAMLASWFDAFDGRVAMSMAMDMKLMQAPKVEAVYVMGSTDAAAMRKIWRDIMGLMVARATKGTADIMGTKFDIGFREKILEFDGVEVDRYDSKLNTEGMSDEMRKATAGVQVAQVMHFATFDNFAVMAMSEDSAKTIESSIAAARGMSRGLTLLGAPAEALERSINLRESLFFSIDLAKIIPGDAPSIPFSAVTLGVGQEGGALRVRISLHK